MAEVKIDAAYTKALDRLRAAIGSSLSKAELQASALVCLALHDATTYDQHSNTSGANGSIRTKKELDQAGNQGLDGTVSVLARVKASEGPNITNADVFQLAAIIAVQSTGGPVIAFTPGRKDSWAFPPPGRLLSPNTGHHAEAVAQVQEFAQRTGLLLRAVVALLGAASLTRWWGEDHETVVPSGSPAQFDNSFFRKLVEGQSPTDGWLLSNDELRGYCEDYAADQALFMKDYATAHEEMSRLGTKLQPTTATALAAVHAAEAGFWESLTPGQAAAGAVVVAGVAVIAASYWWSRRRRLRRLV